MRAVLVLDFDGTVLDTEWPACRAAAELWEAHGIDLTIEIWAARIGTHARLDPFRELEQRLGRTLDPSLNCEGELPAKPDPPSYLHAVEQLGGKPAHSVAVEDSANGVTAAVTAGLFTVAVPHDLTAHMDLSGADVVVESLDELSLSDALGRARRRAHPPQPRR